MITTLGIIGHYGGNKEYFDGQTVKTKEIDRQLSKEGYTINRLDTHSAIKHILKIQKSCKKMLESCDVVILIVSKNGYKVLAPLLVKLNKKYHKKIIDIVIGGSRYNLFDRYKRLLKTAHSFNKIFVETRGIQVEYEKRGFTNTEIMYNFKDIKINANNKKLDKTNFKTCTFSRVRKEKGIEDAVEAVKIANRELGKAIFSLDIYGPIDKDYEKQFKEMRQKFPPFIRYMGTTRPNQSSEILGKYDLMLFLTFWPSEGFPGTLIDAMAAGVPVVATNWKYNCEVLDNGRDSFIVSPPDVAHKVSLILINSYHEYDKIKSMRHNCNRKAGQYMAEDAIRPLIKAISS